MSHAARIHMTVAEFLAWERFQDVRHELVDGVPYAMAGAKRRHDRIVTNVLAGLHGQLLGTLCEPFSSDQAVLIPAVNVRRPDAGVHCGPFDDDSLTANDPRLVVEVFSPSTRSLDQVGKLEEYKTIESVACIVLIDPDVPQAIVWTRGPDRAWRHDVLHGLDAAITVASISVFLRLEDIYAGLAFEPRPRLITTPEGR